MTNSVLQLHELGQSLWLDNIERRLLRNGELKEMIARGEIRGVTSNPSIFMKAITQSDDYDDQLDDLLDKRMSTREVYEALVVEDIRAAADLFRELYEATQGGDGYVSLEVNPHLAHDTDGTIEEARHLWEAVDRPNLMIKIPATGEGVSAIRDSLAAGLNINITLIFSLERYRAVIEAFLEGLERRVANGQPVDRIASVASFFVSRVDTKVDQRLSELIKKEDPRAQEALRLRGQIAVANAKMAYAQFLSAFAGERFARLRRKGARVQRPLWASTSTKNPEYSDVKYVEELIGPETINTIPPQTLKAFHDHGKARQGLAEGFIEARRDLESVGQVGIAMDQVTAELEDEGVEAFARAFDELIMAIKRRRQG